MLENVKQVKIKTYKPYLRKFIIKTYQNPKNREEQTNQIYTTTQSRVNQVNTLQKLTKGEHQNKQ